MLRTWPCITLAVCLGALSSHGESIRARYRADLASEVSRRIDARWTEWFAYYKDLHANPELSEREKETSRKIAEKLEASGYDVTTNIGGYGVAGVLKNGPGPTVMVRGDMDALPIVEETDLPYRSTRQVTLPDGHTVGVMHACGHDVHQTCLLGTAETLAGLRDRWSGTVVAIAQPAEEIGKGARRMIEDGLFSRVPRPDYCLALHVASDLPAGRVAYTSGWALANVDSVDITIFGRGGHGSRPNEAIDPIVTAAHVITSLQTIVSRRLDPREPGVITVGSIHGGSKHNIIPPRATMQLTVRSYADETRQLLLEGIRRVTVETAQAMGCPRDPIVHLREDEYTPAAYNDPELAAAAVGVLERALGPDRVIEKKPVMGGEDFGRFPAHLEVPGLIFWLGAVEQGKFRQFERSGAPLPALHSSEFAPDPEPSIKTGVRALTSIALSLLDEND